MKLNEDCKNMSDMYEKKLSEKNLKYDKLLQDFMDL